MQVLPPANGKKLWRVKRASSTGSASERASDSSLECLNNSLKISAAGNKFMMKRPPTKRPRAKSGSRRDFVFVDLSPVKSEQEIDSPSSANSDASFESSSLPYNGCRSPLSVNSNSSSASVVDNNENLQQSLASYDMRAAMFDETSFFGLGLMDMNYDYNQPSLNNSCFQNNLFEYPAMDLQQQTYPHAPMQFQDQSMPITQYDQMQYSCAGQQLGSPFSFDPTMHRRAQSTSAIPRVKAAGEMHFKTYKGPCNVKKPAHRRLKRTLSQPSENIMSCLTQSSTPQITNAAITPVTPITSTSSDFDYFSLFSNDEIDSGSDSQGYISSSNDDFCNVNDFDSLFDESNMDIFTSCQAETRLQKEDFDFTTFIAA